MVLPSRSDFGVPCLGIHYARHIERQVEIGIHFVYTFAMGVGVRVRKPPEPHGEKPSHKNDEWIFQGRNQFRDHGRLQYRCHRTMIDYTAELVTRPLIPHIFPR